MYRVPFSIMGLLISIHTISTLDIILLCMLDIILCMNVRHIVHVGHIVHECMLDILCMNVRHIVHACCESKL